MDTPPKITSEPGSLPFWELPPNPRTNATPSPLPIGDSPKCVHHWLILDMHVRWARSKARGPFVEDTHWVCRDCGAERDNTVSLPFDRGYESGAENEEPLVW